MTTETTVDIGSLIHYPEERHGRPCLAGTGMSVYRVVTLHQMGMTPQEMHESIEDIPVSHFYAALAYYYANREAVDAYLKEAQGEADHLHAKWSKTHPQHA